MALLTQGDIIAEVLVRLNTSTTVGFYTDAMLSGWVSQANNWAASLHKWPFNEGRFSTTSASLGTSEDGYTVLEYPESLKSDSIRYLTIGGKKLDKKNFYKFAEFYENNPADTGKTYTDFARRVYINPNTGLTGTVVAWGQKNIDVLDASDPTANTIFTGITDQGNLALVQEVMSYALEREKSQPVIMRGKIISASIAAHQLAEEILDTIWKDYAEEQALYQDTQNDGMFKRFDVLRGGYREDIFRRDQFF